MRQERTIPRLTSEPLPERQFLRLGIGFDGDGLWLRFVEIVRPRLHHPAAACRPGLDRLVNPALVNRRGPAYLVRRLAEYLINPAGHTRGHSGTSASHQCCCKQ